MKKIFLYLSLIGCLQASAQDCIKNAATSEPMLLPTPQDSINYQLLQEKHAGLPPFSYKSIAYTRGLIDTALFFSSKVTPTSPSLRDAVITSPLIVEGVITQISEADTSSLTKNKYYTRNYTIQIKGIVKSKYKLATGDKITVKSNMSGYRRDTRTKVQHYSSMQLIEFYEKGKTYLFVLDKYEYMQTNYLVKNGDIRFINYSDEYCPSAFSFLPSTVGISKEYAQKKFTIEQLKQYLSKK